jgi:hypothetical protein
MGLDRERQSEQCASPRVAAATRHRREELAFGVFETTEDDQQLGERVEQAVGATVAA